MKSFTGIVCLLILTSCYKEKITTSNAYIKNLTAHNIEVAPYSNGVVDLSKVFSLSLNQEKQIGDGFVRGKVGNVGFSSEFLSNADSIIVTFDHLYKITHYFVTPLAISPKHYLYSSLRNLGNYLSYQYSSEDQKKTNRLNTYVYTFTEQDYLDAK